MTWIDVSTSDNLGNTISSGDYTLTWYFSGPTAFNVVSTADGDGWQTTLTSEITSAMKASRSPNYYWQATATNGSSTTTIGSGRITIQKNLATAEAGYDGRTQAEQDLSAVQAAISARINGGAVSEYVIGTRRLKNEPISELIALESRLKLIISKERQAQAIANGLGDPRNTFVRFTNG